MTRFRSLLVVLGLAVRNVASQPFKTAVVGLVLTCSASLLVLSLSLLSSLTSSMEGNITSTVAVRTAR